ncbi:MAG: MGMT family protein [Proteobacteria bacterium]|nr:MGMT family protein [Pseudomonadota bacterium]
MPRISFSTKDGLGELSFNAKGVSSVELPEVGRLPGDEKIDHLPGMENAALAAELLRQYFKGEPVYFDDVKVDLSGHSPFFNEVCEQVRSIPVGQVMSYAKVASLIGKRGSARAVGRVMANNPVPIIVPCHRVVAADGRLTGYSAAGGLETKAALLSMEGVELREEGRVVL